MQTIRYFIVLGLCCLFYHAAFSQDKKQPEEALKLSQELRKKAVEEVSKLFDERYVFPEKATEVRKLLEENFRTGKYDPINSGQELATRLTTDIQSITKDKHVRVNFVNEKIPVNRKSEPTPEDIHRRREEARIMNGGILKLERLPGNLGYLRIDGFGDPEACKGPLQAAMSFLQHTDALIIDLRYNGGGSPFMVRDLCSYFFGEKPVLLNRMYFRRGDRTEEFHTTPEVPGPKYLKKDVYLLTSAFTFSGAEEFAYNLQTQKRATLVGETTGGGAHPGGTVPFADHFYIFIPTGRAINPITNTNWEGVGVKPEVQTDADKAMEAASEVAIKKLLQSDNKEIAARVKNDVEFFKRNAERQKARREATLKERTISK